MVMNKGTVIKRLFIVAALISVILIIQPGYAVEAQVNINHASLEELASLKYVGETIAKRIIEYRKKKGGFNSLEDLLNVKGIGPKTLEANKDRIVITPFRKVGD
jgi:competence protein ComEA